MSTTLDDCMIKMLTFAIGTKYFRSNNLYELKPSLCWHQYVPELFSLIIEWMLRVCHASFSSFYPRAHVLNICKSVSILAWYCTGAAFWCATQNRARWDWYCGGTASVELWSEWNMTAAEIGMEWFTGERARFQKEAPPNQPRLHWDESEDVFCIIIKRCALVVRGSQYTQICAPAGVFLLRPIDYATKEQLRQRVERNK